MIKKGERKRESIRPSVRSLQLMSSLHTYRYRYRLDRSWRAHARSVVCFLLTVIRQSIEQWNEDEKNHQMIPKKLRRCCFAHHQMKMCEEEKLIDWPHLPQLIFFFFFFFFLRSIFFFPLFSFCASDLSIGAGDSICGSNHRATRAIFVNCFFSSISVSVNTEINCQSRVDNLRWNPIKTFLRRYRIYSNCTEKFCCWVNILNRSCEPTNTQTDWQTTKKERMD